MSEHAHTSQCMHGEKQYYHLHGAAVRCPERTLGSSVFCAAHLREALARVPAIANQRQEDDEVRQFAEHAQ